MPVCHLRVDNKKKNKKKRRKKSEGKKRLANGCTLYFKPIIFCAQQVLVTALRFAEVTVRAELRGASWKLKIKFYPLANVVAG